VALMFDVPASAAARLRPGWTSPNRSSTTALTLTLRCPDHIVTNDVLPRRDDHLLTRADGTRRGRKLADELDGKVGLILERASPRFSKVQTDH